MQNLRMAIVRSVLPMALDAKDRMVIDACRRLIKAETIGWRKGHDPRDWELVKEFSDHYEGASDFE